jgi:hypothetical protein
MNCFARGYTVAAISSVLLFISITDSLAQSECGPPPSFSTTQKVDESVKGELQGQADFLSKLVGNAQLSGAVEAARTSIYQTSDQAFAAQKDAYLSYMFCVIVTSDKAFSTKEKLEALNEFRRPAPSGIKDRSKFIKALQGFYAEGAVIQVSIDPPTVTDDQINSAVQQANEWGLRVYKWLQSNMTPAAAVRFGNNSDKFSFGANLLGDHPANMREKRNDALNFMAGSMTNLETLMKSDQFDPQ